MATPAEPVNPVSQANRSSDAGRYSFWWRSARGTMKPVSPRRASSARNRSTRAAVAARSSTSSKVWNWASNIAGTLWAGWGWGNRAWVHGCGASSWGRQASPSRSDHHERRPAVELDAAFERKPLRAVGRQRGVRLTGQQAGQDDTGTGTKNARHRCCQLLQWREQDVGENEVVGRARPNARRSEARGPHDFDQRPGAIAPHILPRGLHRRGVDIAGQHG